MNSGLGQIKQLMADDNKFREKIESKQFLIGRFETSLNEKLKRKAKRPKKIEKSRFRAMLEKQVKPHLQTPLSYACFQPLNKLWNMYMKDLTQNEKNQEALSLKLLRADFHGALITVLASKVTSYEGLQGIVLKQTLRTFEIITKQDRILRILKKNTLFLIRSQTTSFKLYGCNLVFRPADRIKYKFKYKPATSFILSNS